MRRATTDAEATMWQILRHRRLAGFKFRRQVPFENYIVDLVCFEQKIIIEIDGSQHFESRRDNQRDSILSRAGFRVLRYWNNDVLQRTETVSEHIFTHLSDGTA